MVQPRIAVPKQCRVLPLRSYEERARWRFGLRMVNSVIQCLSFVDVPLCLTRHGVMRLGNVASDEPDGGGHSCEC